MNPKIFKITFAYPDFENLGLEYLMALSRKEKHKVKLIYYQVENTYIAKKQKKFSPKMIATKIARTNPDLVGFSCVTDNYQHQLKCAKALKKIKPEVITIFGGIHPTAVPKVVLQEKAVDAIAIGEADISFIQFLQNCKKINNLTLPNKKIQGIIFKKKNKIVGDFKEGPLADLNNLPIPYKDPFFSSSKEIANEYRIITSRGCPYSCTYCFNSFVHKMRGKRILRQRSATKVIEELLWAKKKYKLKNIFFIDDSFTTNKKWVRQFSKLYKKKINLPFACIANPDYIDEEMANLLKSAGCIFIQMGIQSLSKDLCRKVINRPATLETITQAIIYLKKNQMMIQVDHMLGIPGDTLKNQEEAVLYYNQYRPEIISIFWLTYYPKTPIIQTALKQKLISLKEIKRIEQGKRSTKGSIHDGGSMKNSKPYYSIQFLLNYLPFLPKWLVKKLITTHLYRLLRIRNYYLSTALPRIIHSLIDKRYFTGRSLLVSFFEKRLKLNIVK